MKEKVNDPFSGFKELEKFDFYAADGHYQKTACFDPKPGKEGGSQVAPGHFFRLNLHLDHLDHLDLSRPTDGKKKTYTYITNEMTLPAWAIVLMYKQRWNIEKVFHQFKSKMEERKSWASSEEVKQAHAVFECLAHNLALLFEGTSSTKRSSGRPRGRKDLSGAPCGALS